MAPPSINDKAEASEFLESSLPQSRPDNATDEDLSLEMTPEETKRLLRKIDLRLLPLLTVLYILSFMDRSNIGNARVAGMNDDLGLTGPQYNLCLTVFFFPYSLFEVPSNVVLKLIRPCVWISILVVSWGTVLTLQGIVQNYTGLLLTRIFLGVAEAGFFPAATYLLTTWYCRWEYQTRVAIFFSAASLAGSFSGLLAYAIQHMDGVAGLGGWRWIFILEGILTGLIGISVPWLLPDSPVTCNFLNDTEKARIIHRLGQDAGSAGGEVAVVEDKFEWRLVKDLVLDYKIYLCMIMYWGNSICLYAFSFAAPNIILQLGYSAANAQLMTIPIYFLGAVVTYTFARIADKRQTRWAFVVIPFCIACVGFVALLSIPHPRFPGVTYAFLFAIPAGVYPAVICAISWAGNNLAGPWKRSIGMGFLMTVGNLGGAIGANIFLDYQAPKYPLGYGLCLAVALAGIIAAVVLRFLVRRENKRREAISEEDVFARHSREELLSMGDKSPLFRYVT